MADSVPTGTRVVAGTYRCTKCSFELNVPSSRTLPVCPACGGPNKWQPVAGGAGDPIASI